MGPIARLEDRREGRIEGDPEWRREHVDDSLVGVPCLCRETALGVVGNGVCVCVCVCDREVTDVSQE